jgi:hypothetical protein
MAVSAISYCMLNIFELHISVNHFSDTVVILSSIIIFQVKEAEEIRMYVEYRLRIPPQRPAQIQTK